MGDVIIVDGSRYSIEKAREEFKKSKDLRILYPVNPEFFSVELFDDVEKMDDILREEMEYIKGEALRALSWDAKNQRFLSTPSEIDRKNLFVFYGTAEDVLSYVKRKNVNKIRLFITNQVDKFNKIDFTEIINNSEIPVEVERGTILPEDVRIWDIVVKNVISVDVPGTRDDLLKTLKENKISGVPVSRDGHLVGIATRTDILKNLEEDQLAMLMTRNPITISPHSSVIEAAKVLLEKKIRRLPVVLDTVLIGIVTVADVMRCVANIGIEEEIKDYVNEEVTSVWDGTPLPVVTRIMDLAKMKALPVLDDAGQLTGIITDEDIIRVSKIEDYIEVFADSPGYDNDEWTWECVRNVESYYYGVSRIEQPMIPVKNIMARDVVKVSNTSKASGCALRMVRNRIDQLPVVSAKDELIGMLHDRDLMKVLL